VVPEGGAAQPDGLILQIEKTRFDFRRACVGFGYMDGASGRKERSGIEIEDANALHALNHDVMCAVRGSHVTQDIRECPDPVEIIRSWIVDFPVSLQQDSDLPFFAYRLLNSRD